MRILGYYSPNVVTLSTLQVFFGGKFDLKSRCQVLLGKMTPSRGLWSDSAKVTGHIEKLLKDQHDVLQRFKSFAACITLVNALPAQRKSLGS